MITQVTTAGINDTDFNFTLNSAAVTSVTDNVSTVTLANVSTETISDPNNFQNTNTTDLTSDGTSYFREVFSYTSTDGITPGAIGISTVHTSEGAVEKSTLHTTEANTSSALVVSVVVPVLVIAAVVFIILICLFRRRGFNKGTVRVWQVARTHTIPQPKRQTTWHEDEKGAEDNSSFNPDIELQPSNIFTNSNASINHDEDTAAENDLSINSSYTDIESAVSDSENNPIRPQDYMIKSGEDTKNTDSDNESIDDEEKEDKTPTCGADMATSDAKRATTITERFKIVENTIGDYDFADPIGYNDVKSEGTHADTNGKEDGERIVAIVNEDEGEYVAMKMETDENGDAGRSEEIVLRHEHDSDDIYTNVDIRKVQSMQVMSYSKGDDQPVENKLKRIASESGMHPQRPPIAQPRLSKKKTSDPNDFPPSLPVRAPVNNIPSRNVPTDGHSLHEEHCSEDGNISETSGMSQRINEDSSANNSENDEPEAEDLYDYPRKYSQADEDDDSIYKVPPSRYS